MKKIDFYGASGWKLENDLVSAVILPEHGGKVASFVEKSKQFELLFQNPKATFEKASLYSNFAEFEACGFDDAFPGVNEETVVVGGKEVVYPDHGEIWSAPFSAQAVGETLVLSFTSPLLGYTYQKTVSLVENRLVCQYVISNPTKVPLPVIWTCHCLVRHEADMKIMLPQEAKTVKNLYPTTWLGETNQIWPVDDPEAPAYLREFPPYGDLKYEVEQAISSGACGYWYPKSQIKAMFAYDGDKLPYLGFWCTAGGFRGDWNCALEPSNGYYDDIAMATANGKCPLLQPGDTMAFSFEISLEPQG